MKKLLMAAFLATLFAAPALRAETGVLDSIAANNILRCGYLDWAPLSSRNPETGKLQGFYIDLTEELAHGLGWKVEWTEEIAINDFIPALDNRRIDMLCGPVTPAIQRVRYAYFTVPHFYAPYHAYVRAADKRFDGNPAAIDDPSVTIATLQGEMTGMAARAAYPRARLLEITPAQGPGQLYENVAARKADIVFQDPFTFSAYAHEGILRKLEGGDISFFQAGYAVKFGEDRLVTIINAAIQDLMNRGYIERLMKKYKMPETGAYLPADRFRK